MQLPKFLQHILTEPDNSTFCPIRIIALVGSVQYLGTELHNYIAHAAFDPLAFAGGLGAIVTGAGVALGLKKDTPKEQ
jgi:hypothetical protein